MKDKDFKDQLNYIPPVADNKQAKRKLKQMLIWLNLVLILRQEYKNQHWQNLFTPTFNHFPPNHNISYSYVISIANCRVKNDCSRNGEVQTPAIAYQVDVPKAQMMSPIFSSLTDTLFKKTSKDIIPEILNTKSLINVY